MGIINDPNTRKQMNVFIPVLKVLFTNSSAARHIDGWLRSCVLDLSDNDRNIDLYEDCPFHLLK